MKPLIGTLSLVAICLLCVPAGSHAQCTLNCPAGDGMVFAGAPFGVRSPDQNLDSTVNLIDLAIFAGAYPPLPYALCSDFNNDGIATLVDLAQFGAHYLHFGVVPPPCL